MATVIIETLTFKENHSSKSCREFLSEKGISCSVYITSNGKLVQETDVLEDGKIYRIIPRVLGGKGGFGSMLRSIGAQIEKTTNREACRDLSGRRMRDVNNEQHLRDWVAKKAARERERERRRRERADKRRQALTDHRHNFDDPDYHSQKMKVLDRLDEALRQGFMNKKPNSNGAAEAAAASACPVDMPSTSQPSTSGTKKRKAANDSDEDSELHTKKACEWLGIDIKDLSGLDSDSDDSSGDPSDHESSLSKGTDSETVGEGTSDGGTEDKNSLNCGPDERETTVQILNGGENVTHPQPEHQQSVQKEPGDIKSAEQEGRALVTGERKVGLLEKLKEVPPSEDKQEPQGPIHLEDYTSAVELESLGLDRLKSELMSMGLKCGGTLQQRAERLWAVRGKSKEEIDPSFFAKPARYKKK